MNRSIKITIALLRVGMGWLFFYAGITKVLDPTWTSQGYLEHAVSFPRFFELLASPQFIPVVDFLNMWGLTLIGAALITGFSTRLVSSLGMLLMFLYWLPVLNFPLVGEHSFLVDDHIMYILVLAVLYATRAGRFYGLSKKFVFKVK